MELKDVFEFARRIAEAIAEGRVEASKVKNMTDDQLAEFDKDAYQALLDAQAANEKLASEPE